MFELNMKSIRKIFHKQALIFITTVILTLGNSRYLIEKGVSAYMEYAGYFLLMCGILYYFLRSEKAFKIQGMHVVFGIVVMLFSIGIVVQPISVFTKIRLVLTMVAIASVAIISEAYMDTFANIRIASYGILAGTILTTVVSLVNKVDVFRGANEGILKIGFIGGLENKNYYAGAMLASFMGLFLFRRYGNGERKEGRIYRLDMFVMILETFLIILSSSRGGYVLYVIFLLSSHYDKLNLLRKHKYIAVLCCLAVLTAGIFLYCKIALDSGTYLYRVRGVLNYIEYHKGDWFHLLFGNAEMAFEGSESSYVRNIRAVVGWDGTYEMGFVNALIKNGLAGIVGYAIIFIRIFVMANRTQDRGFRCACMSVWITLLVSSLVESYVCNVHTIFGVYCYMVMCGLCGGSRNGGINRREGAA